MFRKKMENRQKMCLSSQTEEYEIAPRPLYYTDSDDGPLKMYSR